MAEKLSYLCIVCRQPGHVMQSCPYFAHATKDQYSGFQLPPDLEAERWTAAYERPYYMSRSDLTSVSISHTLCERCKGLDILGAFTATEPFTLADKNPNASAKRKVLKMHRLGHILTLQFHQNCPLCRLLFSITTISAEDIGEVTGRLKDSNYGELLLVPAWAVHRGERELEWQGHEKGKGKYSRVLYTMLKPATDDWSWGMGLVDEAIDALGVLDNSGEAAALGVKRVKMEEVDYNMMRRWLRRCDELHLAMCQPLWSEDLKKIRLVDVTTCKVVNYPEQPCAYITLSYVWGDVIQPRYTLGDTVGDAPATIKDAIEVTRKLGMRYIWVDSVCIDQANEKEKLVQIGLMSAIYSGAWASIVAMSGKSAQTGLPRVGSSENIIPQPLYEISGKQLVSTMPTLSQQISRSPWVKRAWTFQEGLLSPRRLYFTRHQVYFECNSFQCCESLDDSHSPFHCMTDKERLASVNRRPKNGPLAPERTLGRGVLRDPFRKPFGDDSNVNDSIDPFTRYMKLVYTYTSKKMTKDVDSINAFTAVLTRLKEVNFTEGFLAGLPIEEFPRALLWTHASESVRRRVEFPAWSWAGWEGTVKPILVKGARGRENGTQPPLRFWRADEGTMGLIYEFMPTRGIENSDSNQSDSEDSQSGSWVTESSGNSQNSDIEDNQNSHIEGSQGDDSEDGGPIESQSSGSEYLTGPENGESGSLSDAELESLGGGGGDGCQLEPESDDDDDDDPGLPAPLSKGDPVFELARLRSNNISAQSEGTVSNVLLIEGIIIKFRFKRSRPSSWPASERQNGLEYTDENFYADYQLCDAYLGDTYRRQQALRIYGGNAKQVLEEREGKVQDFLLLAREEDFHLWHSLLLLDWEGGVASRVAVASLGLERWEPEILGHSSPELRVFKLR